VLNTDSSRRNIFSNLVTDIVLLLIMLLGLFRLRLHGGVFGLGRLLLRQVRFWQFALIFYEVAHIFLM
jgi:hypothetical protein